MRGRFLPYTLRKQICSHCGALGNYWTWSDIRCNRTMRYLVGQSARRN